MLVKEQKLLTLPEFMPVFSGIRFVQSLVFCVMLCGSLFVLCSVGPCIVPVLLTAFVWSLYCLCTTYGFRLVILLYLYYIRLSFGHFIVSVLLTAFVWSLYCLCTTYGFRLVIVLSMYYLRLSFGHCIVSVLLTAFVWSLYCLCTTKGFWLHNWNLQSFLTTI